jgi:membrane peptidoglycan carboxypeptidase
MYLTRDNYKIQPYASFSTGANELSPMDMAAGAQTIANGGLHAEPYFIERIEVPNAAAPNGVEVLTPVRPAPMQVISKEVADHQVDILKKTMTRGTARRSPLDNKRPSAGKTGTQDENTNAWFVGFTPSLVAGVWTGFDDNRKTGLTGGSASAPTWGKFMKCIEPYLAHDDFAPPSSVSMVNLDSRNRKQYPSECPPPRSSVLREVFLKGTEPREECFYDAEQIEPEEYRDTEIQRRPAPQQRRQRDAQSFWDSVWDWG